MRSLETNRPKTISTSQEVFSLVQRRLRRLEVEHFLVLHLDAKHRVEAIQTVSQGTRTECLVHPREVFCEAVRRRAVAVIVCHNHPSGDAEPSREDFDLTTRLYRAGELLGIPLLDHLIVGKGVYLSLADVGFVGTQTSTKADSTNCSANPKHPYKTHNRTTESQ